MRIGTKSVLFGAHCFLLHPWFVALGWWKLYGFPFDPRLWVAFFVHDLGYWGKPNMDGPEGELHPRLGARIMSFLFDGYTWRDSGWIKYRSTGKWTHRVEMDKTGDHLLDVTAIDMAFDYITLGRWGKFVFYHSRYLAKSHNVNPSRLCAADKLATALTPAWLYLPMVRATGEIREYRHYSRQMAEHETMNHGTWTRLASSVVTDAEWFKGVQDQCRTWALLHKDGGPDRVTRRESKARVH